jgi:hypothetical protein
VRVRSRLPQAAARCRRQLGGRRRAHHRHRRRDDRSRPCDAGTRALTGAAISALTADVVNWENQIAATKSLIADLSTRAGIEGRNSSAEKSSVPPKQKPRKARRRRRKPVAARKRTPTAPVPVAVPASGYQRKAANAPLKAVRGAATFATELQAIDEIVAALSKADHALTKATRARDAAGITAASEKIQQLRRQGNELLVRLGGKARLPIDKAERMR